MNDYRIESDLIGELKVPVNAYYGVQTQRAIDNFKISNDHLSDHPEFIKAFAFVKKAAAQTNFELGLLDEIINKNIATACDEIIAGKMHKEFPTDMIQGGAGTSMNMNANEVIANRALELMGHQKGEYQFCSPNDHVNLSQSTNDAYPTAIRIALYNLNKTLVERLELLIQSFRKKADDLKDVIKMGRTQLQDAVPMTMGQEFNAFANTLQEEIARLNTNADLFLETNMGATAIGTGLNAHPDYAVKCTENLAKISGADVVLASDLVEATPDTGAYVIYSSAMKRMAVKLSKICNDLRLLASGEGWFI